MIDGISNKGIGSAGMPAARAAPAAADRKARPVDSAPPGGTVLASLAQPTAPVDQARTDSLRARIADGSYRADPAAIARAMIERGSSD